MFAVGGRVVVREILLIFGISTCMAVVTHDWYSLLFLGWYSPGITASLPFRYDDSML
jgi:hypothetical protein